MRVASHLSNLPAMVVEDFTWNLIELSTGVISKTGACARLHGGSMANTKRQRTADREKSSPKMKNRTVGIEFANTIVRLIDCYCQKVPTVKSYRATWNPEMCAPTVGETSHNTSEQGENSLTQFMSERSQLMHEPTLQVRSNAFVNPQPAYPWVFARVEVLLL